MKTYVKREKIIIKYKQYLKLEKSLSENTVQAYLTDLDKLFAYLTLENIDYTKLPYKTWKHFPPDFMISESILGHKHAYFPAYVLFTIFWYWMTISSKILQNYWNLLKSENIFPMS